MFGPTLGAIEIEERIIGAAKDVGNDLPKELDAEVKWRRKGDVAEAAAAGAIPRFEQHGGHAMGGEVLPHAHPDQSGPDDDHIEVVRITGAGWRRCGLLRQSPPATDAWHKPSSRGKHEGPPRKSRSWEPRTGNGYGTGSSAKTRTTEIPVMS
jgi:hypothetical protein